MNTSKALASVKGMSLEQVRNKYASLKTRMSGLSNKTESGVEIAKDAGATLAGAAIAGAIDGGLGGLSAIIPDVGVAPSTLVGAAASVAGIFGFGGKNAGTVARVGVGMLAPAAYNATKNAVSK